MGGGRSGNSQGPGLGFRVGFGRGWGGEDESIDMNLKDQGGEEGVERNGGGWGGGGGCASSSNCERFTTSSH